MRDPLDPDPSEASARNPRAPADEGGPRSAGPSTFLDATSQMLDAVQEQIRVLQDVRSELMNDIAEATAPLIADELQPALKDRIERALTEPIQALSLLVDVTKAQNTLLSDRLGQVESTLAEKLREVERVLQRIERAST